MDPLTDIIQRCHQRHKDPLRQRKTVAASVLYKGFPYCFEVYCAHRYAVMLDYLEQADISFMPIGRAPANDRGPSDFGGERFSKRQRAANWKTRRWLASWGIQVYTGTPSERDGARWHDIDFKYEALCAAPDAVLACVEALVNAVENPLLTMSKDGGLRFSCRIPDYLHPSTQAAKQYIYKHNPAAEASHARDVYLEIFGEAGYSCWDARYEILMGNLLDPPVISERVLFAPIDVLRAALHEPTPSDETELDPAPIVTPSLGSHNLQLAREAFLKRGFSYLRQEDTFHHWVRRASTGEDVEMTLWEDAGTVWIRAATPNIGLPTEPTPITHIWDNTGILPPIPPTGLPVSNTILAIREGTLSPLAIKRPHPILHKPETTKAVDEETLKEKPVQTHHISDSDARILALTTETGTAIDTHIEAYLCDGGAVCLNMASDSVVREAMEHFQGQNVPSVVHWEPLTHPWEKGGNPISALQGASAQMVAVRRLFFDPQYADILEKALQHPNEVERLCVVETAKMYELFPVCKLSKDVLETWITNWQGSVLGDFARFLLNAIEIKGTPDSNAIRRVRAAFRAFASEEDTLIEQMCQVNVQGKNPNWTYWHQLKFFFDYYTRDADAPMHWDDQSLWFWTPPILHPSTKRLLVMAANFSERHLRRTFPNESIDIIRTEPVAWGAGNRLFQIRTGNYTLETIIDYDNTWDVLSLSEAAQHFFLGIRAEIERDPNVKHAIITYQGIIPYLEDFSEKENVCLVSAFNEIRSFESTLKEADVLWVVGTPYWAQGVIWHRSQILFGNDEIPLSYKKEDESDVYSDERVQSVYEQNIVNYLTEIIGYTGLDIGNNRKVVLITSFPLPGITDKPEALLFDWADFEVAGSLDKLPEVIATREQFEAERETLTAESSREEVERVLGCSTRQANRVLKKFRGGKPLRVPFREQILSHLSDGEKKTATLVEAIEGHPKAINNELTRLVDAGEIVKVRRGVYALP